MVHGAIFNGAPAFRSVSHFHLGCSRNRERNDNEDQSQKDKNPFSYDTHFKAPNLKLLTNGSEISIAVYPSEKKGQI
jgi:hypothetical protein